MKNQVTMRYCFVLVAAIFASSVSSAALLNGTEPTKIRTFITNLNGTKAAVHFNSLTSQLAVCALSNGASCVQWKVQALDILPFNGSLLVVDGPFLYRSCSIKSVAAVPNLDCQNLTSESLLAQTASVSDKLQFISTEGYDCGYSFKTGLLCSSAQPFQPAANAMLFGHFTGDQRSLQIIALNTIPVNICDIGKGCREAQGLDVLSTNQLVTASERINSKIDRTHLLGISQDSQSACAAYFESDSRVGFRCDFQVAAPVGTVLQPFTVHGAGVGTSDQIVFVGKPSLSVVKLSDGTGEEKSAGSMRAAEIKALAADAYRNAGGRMTTEKFKAALYARETEAALLKVARPLVNKNPPDFAGDQGPDYYSFSDSMDGISQGAWTDTYGYEYIAWDIAPDWGLLTKQECLVICTAQRGLRDSFCATYVNAVFHIGAVVTVGATVVTAWTGPGAAGVALIGIGVTGTAGGAAQAQCTEDTLREQQRCIRSCN